MECGIEDKRKFLLVLAEHKDGSKEIATAILEKYAGNLTGGEIAYQLATQSLLLFDIDKVRAGRLKRLYKSYQDGDVKFKASVEYITAAEYFDKYEDLTAPEEIAKIKWAEV